MLKAGSNSLSNQTLTLGGEVAITQPSLGSERTGKACPWTREGKAAAMTVEARTTAVMLGLDRLTLGKAWAPELKTLYRSPKNIGTALIFRDVWAECMDVCYDI